MTAEPRPIALRPKLYERIKFDDGDGSGAWVRDLFIDERNALSDDLAAGKSETAAEVADVRQRLLWCVRLVEDIEADLLRPLPPRRFRIFRGGQAEWVQGLLRDEQAALYDDLARFRAEGRSEDDPDVAEVVQQLRWSVDVLRDVDACLVNLVGPNEDPRP
jgi:hypothetical protein